MRVKFAEIYILYVKNLMRLCHVISKYCTMYLFFLIPNYVILKVCEN